jgi:peptidyl-tRNA hydrolase, PTH1 family
VKCIIGLGNPGNEYAATRHNIGFRVIESIVTDRKIQFHPGDGEYYSDVVRVGEQELVLALPTTYMNNSGVAALELCRDYHLVPDDLLVVFDDFQLPFGTLRIRPHGSDGGHNGLGSIIYHLETDLIARLRIGVGGATIPSEHSHAAMAGYVLTGFEPEEERQLPLLLAKAADACLSWARDGVPKTMNAFNKNFFSDSVEL